MSTPEGAAEPVLFAEDGSRPWVLLFGPVLAGVGIALESLAPGGASVPLWLGVGLLVFLYTLVLVRSRRRFLRVELTPSTLVQGSTRLPMSHVSSLRPVDEEHHGIRVLGDGPVVPRRFGAVVLRLTDGTRAVAWARDAAGLRRALDDLLRARATS
ncbi:DUF3093 family protein [Actinomycetospora cinnamomea]|uniref:DUF3093 family protein n=1 Tax=Actinomycetospora cinnamomea TaxID=663609 RepID=A0A2U1FD14_9PSEU|nr:DUF3093 family protein [Actinomycetospora cinnamomea]PVZ10091.1 hypothetical protein C8D89_105167 [Actinomycetospora cinnamomea]